VTFAESIREELAKAERGDEDAKIRARRLVCRLIPESPTDPYGHQEREIKISALLPAWAREWSMRTGKSKVNIGEASLLWQLGLIDAVLIICPYGVHHQWVKDEIPRHSGIPFLAHAWESRSSRTKWHQAAIEELVRERQMLPWLCVNADALRGDACRAAIQKFMRRRKMLIVFDESQLFKKPGAKRTRIARSLARRCEYRRIQSGTMVGNSPLGLYSQYELLEKGCLGFTRYKDFEDHFAVFADARPASGQRFRILKEYRNLEELRERRAPFTSVVRREDIADMPPLVSSRRYFDLETAQRRAYANLRDDLMTEIEGRFVSAAEGGAALTRLQQVASGWAMDEVRDFVTVVLPGRCPRMALLEEVLSLEEGRAIVWCRFRNDCQRIAYHFEEKTDRGIHQYHGGVKRSRRPYLLDRWREDPGGILVATPDTGGTGLDLSAARHVIWFSHTWDADLRQQASERATKKGGAPVAVTDLVAIGTVDEHMLRLLDSKHTIAEVVGGEGLYQYLLQERDRWRRGRAA